MYCRRCGKFIKNDAEVCKECLEEMLINEMGKKDQTEEVKVIDPDETKNNFFDSVQEIVPPQPEKKKSESMGSQPVFKKALFSVIASSVAIFVWAIGFVLLMVVTIPIGAILVSGCIGVMIYSLCTASQSLSTVKKLVQDGQRRNIPAMVLSIVGIVDSIVGLSIAGLYTLIAMLVLI